MTPSNGGKYKLIRIGHLDKEQLLNKRIRHGYTSYVLDNICQIEFINPIHNDDLAEGFDFDNATQIFLQCPWPNSTFFKEEELLDYRILNQWLMINHLGQIINRIEELRQMSPELQKEIRDAYIEKQCRPMGETYYIAKKSFYDAVSFNR